MDTYTDAMRQIDEMEAIAVHNKGMALAALWATDVQATMEEIGQALIELEARQDLARGFCVVDLGE